MKLILSLAGLAGLFTQLTPSELIATQIQSEMFSGIKIPATLGGTTCSGYQIENVGADDLSIGLSFDPVTGNVAGGDFLVRAYVNIGSATFLQNLSIGNTASSTPQITVGSGIVRIGDQWLPGDAFELGIMPSVLDAPIGSVGKVLVGVAVFSTANQSVLEVPGVTNEFDIIVRAGSSLGDFAIRPNTTTRVKLKRLVRFVR